jgi:hypothetical protein
VLDTHIEQSVGEIDSRVPDGGGGPVDENATTICEAEVGAPHVVMDKPVTGSLEPTFCLHKNRQRVFQPDGCANAQSHDSSRVYSSPGTRTILVEPRQACGRWHGGDCIERNKERREIVGIGRWPVRVRQVLDHEHGAIAVVVEGQHLWQKRGANAAENDEFSTQHLKQPILGGRLDERS